MRKILKYIATPFFLIVFLLGLIYWTWWLPGVRVANDLTFVSKGILKEQFDLPRLWHDRGSEGMGQFGSFILWSYPMTVTSGFLDLLGLGFSLQERLFFIIPIILFGTIGIRKLLKSYNLGEAAIFCATLYYLSTTYLLLLVDGGQLSIALVYSLFPFAYLQLLESINGNWKTKLVSVLILSLITAFDVRLLFVMFLLLLMRFIFLLFPGKLSDKYKIIRRWLIAAIAIGICWVFLNLYWILPIIKFPISSYTFTLLTQSVGKSTTTWKHAVLLLQPQWYKNVFGLVEPKRFEFIIIPILVILSFASIKRIPKNQDDRNTNLEIVFWIIVGVIGIFLSKGNNPPLGEIYTFLFSKIPGFSLFRDSTKFFFLISLSYSVLIAFSVNWITGKLKQNNLNNLSSKMIPMFFTLYILLLTFPVWSGKMTGMFSKPIFESEYNNVWKIINNDPEFGRILWLPSIPPLGYFDLLHPAVEGLRLLTSRPFIIGTVGAYEQLNFLRESPFVGELLKVSNIKYINYSYPDTKRAELSKDDINYYYAFLDQLTNLAWIDRKLTDNPVPLLKTKEVKERLYISGNSYYVVGSDRIYWDLMSLPDFDLSKNALIFTEEHPGIISNIDANSLILLYQKNELDLLMSFVSKNKFYFPASDLAKDPVADQKFWKREASDLIWWRDFLQTKYGLDNLDFDYGGGWAIGEGDGQLQVVDNKLNQEGTLFARMMVSSKGGRVEFWQGDVKLGEINTLDLDPQKINIKLTGYADIPDNISTYNGANFRWFEIGSLSTGNNPLLIKTFGEINVINSIVSIKASEYNEIEAKIKELQDQKRIINWDDLNQQEKENLIIGENNAYLVYKRINPTKYEVEVNGLSKPSYLIFSESFNSYWELNGQAAKPVFSLLNGYYIEKSGKYILYFTPQKLIMPGFIFSLSVFLIVVFLLVFPTPRKKL